MIDAGVLDGTLCGDDGRSTLSFGKGDVLMGGKNRREHGIQLIFPAESETCSS